MNRPDFQDVRSMTGQGRAQNSNEIGTVSVEIRSVNHRGVKCALRTSDSLNGMSAKIEATVRSLIHRGSVNLNVSWKHTDNVHSSAVSDQVVLDYFQAIQRVQTLAGVDQPIDWASLLELPGSIIAPEPIKVDPILLWNFVHATLVDAMNQMDQMRCQEGQAMADSLRTDAKMIEQRVDQIAQLAPHATNRYQERLESRIRQTLTEHDLSVTEIDLLREVQIYADRTDISEEITRLGSHLDLFSNVLNGKSETSATPSQNQESIPLDDPKSRPDPCGRKLDFIIQEMFRETNTIGSKAGDSRISEHVVEIKCAVERMRELVQNLE